MCSAISGERKSPPAPDDRVRCAVTGLGLLSLCGAVDGQKMTVLKSAQPDRRESLCNGWC